MNVDDLQHGIPALVERLVQSTLRHAGLQHLGRSRLPSRDAVVRCVDLLRQLMFPGYFGKQGLTPENLQYRVGELVLELEPLLHEQIKCALQYQVQQSAGNGHNVTHIAGGGDGVAPSAPCDAATAEGRSIEII